MRTPPEGVVGEGEAEDPPLGPINVPCCRRRAADPADPAAAACFCLHAIARKWCNVSGCGGCLLNGRGWLAGRADRVGSEEQPWSPPGRAKLATLIRLPESFSMMFDHALGEPLGPYRKRSRVESAKRFWRVSRK